MSSHDNYNFLTNWEHRNNDYFSETPVDYLLKKETSALPETKEVEVQVIPKLKETNEISLSKGDTLVVYISDSVLPDMSENVMQGMSDMFEKMFPNNQVLFLPEDFKLGVIRNV